MENKVELVKGVGKYILGIGRGRGGGVEAKIYVDVIGVFI